MRDVEDSDERLVIEMDNRPDLTNIRGAIQGGLVATLIDIAAGRLAGNASRAGACRHHRGHERALPGADHRRTRPC